MEKPKSSERQLKRWQAPLAALGVLVVFACPLPFTLGHANAASEYGALLQGVAGTLALGLLLVALHLQRRDLELTRDEMQENNRTQADQREQLALQLAEMKRQAEVATKAFVSAVRPAVLATFDYRPSSSEVEIGARNVGNGKALLVEFYLVIDGKLATPAGPEALHSLARRFSTAINVQTPTHPNQAVLRPDETCRLAYFGIAGGAGAEDRKAWEALLEQLRVVEVHTNWVDLLAENPSRSVAKFPLPGDGRATRS